MSCLLKTLLLFALPLNLSLAAPSSTLNVLTYSSLLDKGGLGEEIQKEAAALNLKVVFSASKDFAGILGTLRKLKRDKKTKNLNLVMGLNDAHYKMALAENLVHEGSVYEIATFSLLANKKLLPEKDWPKNWDEVKQKLSKKILVQDPRTSEVGLSWLLNSNLSLADSKKIPLKVFPNWSSSFKAFESKVAPVVWTYSTSAAYYACADDPQAKDFANIPLPNYPQDKNYIAFVNKATPILPEEEKFKALVLSEKIQSSIWQKNWMVPALYPNVIKKMPPCFTQVWFPKDAKDVEALNSKELLKRLDQWSL